MTQAQDLLFQMLKSDLALAEQFARVEQFVLAERHLRSAIEKLQQLSHAGGAGRAATSIQAPSTIDI